jgi:nicotinate-nucleotide pyrophosphorylase (carboxylating)
VAAPLDGLAPPWDELAPPWDELAQVVAKAVTEDLPSGDPTGAAVGPVPAQASLVARQAGTIAGLVAVQIVLDQVSRRLGTGPAHATLSAHDGARVGASEALGTLTGPADTLLAAERTLLNVVTHLSGVATLTAAAVDAVAGTGAVIRDTRKTLPGLRAVEKYAVRCGGGSNHRMSLSDAILVKDNHIAALGGVRGALEAARRQSRLPSADGASVLPVEVEVDDLAQLDEALEAGADLVLVDNLSLEDTVEAVRRARRYGADVEASGGLRLDTIRAVAACGVKYLAIGALTHSAPALDIGLDWRL